MAWIIGAAALSLFVCLPLFQYYKKNMQLPLACAFKVLGTLCAAMLVLVAAIKLDPRCWVFFVGMMFHLAADAVLEFRFQIGAGLFLAGHIAYIAYFTQLWPVSSLHFVCFAILLVLAAVLLYQWRKPIGKQMPLFILYAVVLTAMASCAIAGGISSYTKSGILAALGAAFFLVSDAFLLRRILFPSPRAMNWFVMVTYYSAQLLFGAACLL